MLKPFRRFVQRAAEPLVAEALERGRREGELQALAESWQSSAEFDSGRADTRPDTHSGGTRGAYDCLPLFAAAVNTRTALVLGTGVTYGELDDPRAMQALEDWYALNDIENFSQQMYTQWLLDGELLALIAMDASRNEPAWVNLWDTSVGVTVKTEPGNPRLVQSVNLGGKTRQPESFVWRANDTLFNEVRGRSPVRTAVEAAKHYAELGVYRMRAHAIRGRLNAVYYAMAKSPQELAAKAAKYRRLPRDGNVVTIQMGDQGQSEKLEFTNLNTAASDADADTRTYIRTVGMVFGLPEHFFSVGDTGNRATAESMAEPMVRMVEKDQVFLEGVLTELFRKELKRRFGESATFTVNTSELNPDGTRVEGTKQVTADELTIPFNFPPLRDDNGVDLDRVRFAFEAGLISQDSAVEALGFDPLLELERKANDESDVGGVDVE